MIKVIVIDFKIQLCFLLVLTWVSRINSWSLAHPKVFHPFICREISATLVANPSRSVLIHIHVLLWRWVQSNHHAQLVSLKYLKLLRKLAPWMEYTVVNISSQQILLSGLAYVIFKAWEDIYSSEVNRFPSTCRRDVIAKTSLFWSLNYVIALT